MSGTTRGVAHSITPAEWDSAFFGKRIGRLTPAADEGTDLDAVAALDRSVFDCVWIDLDINAAHLLHRWSAIGAHAVDARVELAAALTPTRTIAVPPGRVEAVRSWTAEDRAAVVSLAVEQSAWSRLARDPAFAPRVPRMYENWVGKAISGEDEALVWREGGRIVGMLTSRLASGISWIELLDVESAYRGRGIGGALVRESLARAAASGHTEARVRTQLPNLPAIRTYERCGFTLAHVSLVLHWWAPGS